MHAMSQGRIRFRNGALKVGELGYSLRDELLAAKGILDVQLNKRIGSMLVLFDKARIKAEAIFKRIAEFLHIDVVKVQEGLSSFNRAFGSRAARRNVKLGMGLALGTAIGALAYSGRWHAVAGGAFLTLLGGHLYQNRRTLMS
ncbi:MAG: HMA2 domain-containing protein [Halodesulfovibrio sp.]